MRALYAVGPLAAAMPCHVTIICGQMTDNNGHILEPVRRPGADASPARPAPARRKLSAGACPRVGALARRRPDGPPRPRTGWARRRASRGAQSSFSPESTVLCPRGSRALPPPPHRAGSRAAPARESAETPAPPDVEAPVTISRRTKIDEIAALVAGALGRAGIRAVLTGGACATLYSAGAYQSHDLDFILQGHGTARTLDRAMGTLGFTRSGDRYVHAKTEFFVEFPRGPLAIGEDVDIKPVQLQLRGGSALALSATDACRDRLAAFYHWSDRQSLEAAVEIGLRQPIRLAVIRDWSRKEGAIARFDEFRRELVRRRRARRSRT